MRARTSRLRVQAGATIEPAPADPALIVFTSGTAGSRSRCATGTAT